MSVLQPDSEEYYAQLGKFVHNFSHVEALFYTFIRCMFDKNTEAVHSLLSKSSLCNVIDAIKETFSDIKTPEASRIMEACAHMNLISKSRNIILHNPASIRGDDLYSVDMFSELSGKRNKSARANPEDLINMSADLWKIEQIISFALVERFATITIGKNNNGYPQFIKSLEDVFSSPWRYTLTQDQSSQTHKSQAKRRKAPPRS